MGKGKTDPRILRMKRRGRFKRWTQNERELKLAKRQTGPSPMALAEYVSRSNPRPKMQFEDKLITAVEKELVGSQPNQIYSSQAYDKHHADVAQRLVQTDRRQYIQGFRKILLAQGKEIIEMVFSGDEHYFIRNGNEHDRSIIYWGRKRAMLAFALYKHPITGKPGITWVKS